MRANNDSSLKSERFERLALRRTGDILKKLKLLGNLSNRNNYTYSEAQVKEMFLAIDKEVRMAKDRFNVHSYKSGSEFRFSRVGQDS